MAKHSDRRRRRRDRSHPVPRGRLRRNDDDDFESSVNSEQNTPWRGPPSLHQRQSNDASAVITEVYRTRPSQSFMRAGRSGHSGSRHRNDGVSLPPRTNRHYRDATPPSAPPGLRATGLQPHIGPDVRRVRDDSPPRGRRSGGNEDAVPRKRVRDVPRRANARRVVKNPGSRIRLRGRGDGNPSQNPRLLIVSRLSTRELMNRAYAEHNKTPFDDQKPVSVSDVYMMKQDIRMELERRDLDLTEVTFTQLRKQYPNILFNIRREIERKWEVHQMAKGQWSVDGMIQETMKRQRKYKPGTPVAAIARNSNASSSIDPAPLGDPTNEEVEHFQYGGGRDENAEAPPVERDENNRETFSMNENGDQCESRRQGNSRLLDDISADSETPIDLPCESRAPPKRRASFPNGSARRRKRLRVNVPSSDEENDRMGRESPIPDNNRVVITKTSSKRTRRTRK